ncbi:hypothetical protein PCI56_01760 [Plesiomonas shigelloides subsp. oncorhynchi]|nr:hypothetical protein [Plesiomonas shigelloides]
MQNVLLPFLVIVFTSFIIISYPIKFVFALFMLLYFVYLFFSLLLFVAYIGLISERKLSDLRMAKWIFAYPIYQFLMRMVTAFAMINEIVRRSHEESSMAPWWVLKKGRNSKMKVNFHLDKQNNPQAENGVKVQYGAPKRGGYRMRWYMILAIVISPVVLMAYYLFRSQFLITAPAIVTSNRLH